MTRENDLVLIYLEDKPVSFARVEGIEPDVKPGWYQLKLLVLQVPLKVVTWILRGSYIGGDEFTMGGKRMRLEKVEAPVSEPPQEQGGDPAAKAPDSDSASKGNVISLADLKKK